jgi:hypothetical protein
MVSGPINRVTIFKVPKEEDRSIVLEQFKNLEKSALKVCLKEGPLGISRVYNLPFQSQKIEV